MTDPRAADSLFALPVADLLKPAPARTPALGSGALSCAPAAALPVDLNLHGIADLRPAEAVQLVRVAGVDSQHAVHKTRENGRGWVARGEEMEVPCGT